MSFSRRTNWNQEPNALTRAIEDLKSRGTPIVDVTESNPMRCGFEYPGAILQTLSDPKNLDYLPDPNGMASARQAVARFCGIPTDRMVLTSSTSEAYTFLFRLLLNPGEKVLLPRPCYPLFQFLLELSDATYGYYPLRYSGDQWAIDVEALASLIDSNTRAIILVNPNNPTGSYVKKHELQQLNRLCAKHRLSIISDEVFWDYALPVQGVVDAASLKNNAEVLTFVLGGLSKSAGLPQMKLGWILASGPPMLVQEALGRLEIIADTFLSVNIPAQNALPAWLALAPAINAQLLERVRGNLQLLRQGPVKVLTVEGGWYAVLCLPGIDEDQYVLELLTQHHLLIHPGYFFDFLEEGHLVASLLPKRECFAKMMGILTEDNSA